MALALILALFFLGCLVLSGALRSIPVKELRRRARKDKGAAALYKLAAYKQSAEIFLRSVGAASAAGLVLITVDSSWQLGLITTIAAVWLAWAASRARKAAGWRLRTAVMAAPAFAAAVGILQPVLARLAGFSKSSAQASAPIYEKEDLLELLKSQVRQPHNRLAEDDIRVAAAALKAGDKLVRDIMVPRRHIKLVAADESIGPMVMDELHQTGQNRFPVVKEVTKAANPDIVGSLYIYDLLDRLEAKGRVRDIMQPGANYINEEQDLRGALDGFLKSGHLLLVVVNNFEEIVGVVTLENVLEQIFGSTARGGPDRYDDIRAAAAGGDGQPAEAAVE